jgi:hypothetical protein
MSELRAAEQEHRHAKAAHQDAERNWQSERRALKDQHLVNDSHAASQRLHVVTHCRSSLLPEELSKYSAKSLALTWCAVLCWRIPRWIAIYRRAASGRRSYVR